MSRFKIKGNKKLKAKEIIGYFAYLSEREVYCDGDGCVIAGSKEAMSRYLGLAFPNQTRKHTIKATTFEEIIRGIKLGASYCLDEQSFTCFQPLAFKAGIDVGHCDFSQPTDTGMCFAKIQFVPFISRDISP